MAGVDLGGGGRPQKKKGGLKRPKRRIKIHIDMTPMVDIAFLLLIFYMVATVFSAPLSMEISLPPKPKEGENPPEVEIAQSRLLLMYVDKHDSTYYQIGNMKQPEEVTYQELQQIITEKNRNIPKLVMVLKIDQAASYSMMVDIMDDIQMVERGIKVGLKEAWKRDPSVDTTFSVRFSLQDMTAWDEYVLDIVKAGGTVEE